ncbi:MAG TPA: hypothetical protein VJ963_08725, partial [Bacteroidales bacterium]|nr:hypothetical protein [Bacteroidales bacterium]
LILILSASCYRHGQNEALYNSAKNVSAINVYADSLNPVEEGNGTLYYTIDITGLQTFPGYYEHGKPLQTLLKTNEGCISPALIGMEIPAAGKNEFVISNIKNISQNLDMSSGIADSRFLLFGQPVHVITICHPYYNMISVKIASGFIRDKNFRIRLYVPTENDIENEKRQVSLVSDSNNVAIIAVNSTRAFYKILIWKNNAELSENVSGIFYLEPPSADSVYSFSCQFLVKDSTGRIQTFGETETASKKIWSQFWNNGSLGDRDRYQNGKEDEISYIRQQYLGRILSCEDQDK